MFSSDDLEDKGRDFALSTDCLRYDLDQIPTQIRLNKCPTRDSYSDRVVRVTLGTGYAELGFRELVESVFGVGLIKGI